MCSHEEISRLANFLQACAATRTLRAGAAAHARLLKLRCATGGAFSLWNKVLNLYCRCGLPHIAHQVFDKIPTKDVVSFNTLMSSYLRFDGNSLIAVSLYTQLLHFGLSPNFITFATLLSDPEMAKKPCVLEQIHSHSTKFGLRSNGYVGGALVSGYERCRGLEEAIRAFEEIDEVDSVSWNIMIDACARRGSRKHAVEIFRRMRVESGCGGGFDCFTLTSVLKTCSEKEESGLGMQLHGCALKVGLEAETPVGNSLVTMYSRCGEDMSLAVGVFRGIVEPNIISWTAIVSGMAQSGMAKEAVRFYRDMLRMGFVENEFCFASVLPAFSRLASVHYGRVVHARIIKLEFCLDTTVGNALIDMYLKCGSLEDARLVFETMRSHDVISWSVMIAGLGQHGKGREALYMLKAMRKGGFKPDAVTLLAGLSACSHTGLVDEGLRMFYSMVDDYGVEPRRKHCACVVDMLGRAGRLREAERFIGEMGMDLDPLAWETLLGACGLHGEMELGKRSAEKIMELEPQKDGSYVLLSNIYSERRMWEEKNMVRQRLDASGLRKEAAHSLIRGPEVYVCKTQV